MHHWRSGFFGYGFGFFPFGFHFYGAMPFPRREEYLRMLEPTAKMPRVACEVLSGL